MTTSNSQLQQRVEALEGEVNLLKSEIRQILIDMRDIWLRKSDVISAPQIVQAAAAASPVSTSSPMPAAPPGRAFLSRNWTAARAPATLCSTWAVLSSAVVAHESDAGRHRP